MVLVVLDDGRHRLKQELATLLHRVGEIVVLDRDVIVAEFEIAAHGLEIGLFHFRAHLILFRQVALNRHNGTIEEGNGIIGLGGVV